MDENLIGYLLDALEEPDRRQVEADLRSQPESRARLETLRRALTPLGLDSEAPPPPAGLVVRTLGRVAEERARPLPKAPPPSRRPAPAWRGPRRADLVAAALLLVLVGGLAFPWVARQWHLYGRKACEANLHIYGDALQMYADNNNGRLPQVSETGPRSYAASFVPILHEAVVLANDRHLACDPTGFRSGPPPSIEEVESARLKPEPALFRQRARQLAGNYAYCLGYRERHAARTLDRRLRPAHPGRPSAAAGQRQQQSQSRL